MEHATDTADGPDPTMVGLHTMVLAGQPMLVLDAGEHAVGDQLLGAVQDAGLDAIPRFFGFGPPPSPPRIGLTLEGRELLLEDDSGTALLRVDRGGLDDEWLGLAKRRRGSLVYASQGLGLGTDADPRSICVALETAARRGRVLGGIVGIAERKPPLPLVFG